MQLTARRKVATPVDWRQGGSVIVAPSVKPEDAPGLFPKGVKQHEVPSGKVRYGCFAVVSLYTFKIFLDTYNLENLFII